MKAKNNLPVVVTYLAQFWGSSRSCPCRQVEGQKVISPSAPMLHIISWRCFHGQAQLWVSEAQVSPVTWNIWIIWTNSLDHFWTPFFRYYFFSRRLSIVTCRVTCDEKMNRKYWVREWTDLQVQGCRAHPIFHVFFIRSLKHYVEIIPYSTVAW